MPKTLYDYICLASKHKLYPTGRMAGSIFKTYAQRMRLKWCVFLMLDVQVDDQSTYSWRVVFVIPWVWFAILFFLACMVSAATHGHILGLGSTRKGSTANTHIPDANVLVCSRGTRQGQMA